MPISAWAYFIMPAVSCESIAAMTREDRRANATTLYWMAKLFMILDGI